MSDLDTLKTHRQILNEELSELELDDEAKQALFAIEDDDLLKMILSSRNWNSFCIGLAKKHPRISMQEVENQYWFVRRF